MTSSQPLSPHVQDPRLAQYMCFVGDDIADRFNPGNLTVYEDAVLVAGGVRIQMTIIGESHYAIVSDYKTGNVLFIELLACVDVQEAGFRPSFLMSVQDLSEIKAQVPYANETLTIHVQLGVLDPVEDKDRDHTLLENSDWVQSIEYHFDGPMRPRTVVQARVTSHRNNQVLFLQTLHEYVTPCGTRVEPLTSTTTLVFSQRSET